MTKTGGLWGWGALLGAVLAIGVVASGSAAWGGNPGEFSIGADVRHHPQPGLLQLLPGQKRLLQGREKGESRGRKELLRAPYKNCSVDPGEFKKGHTKAKGWRCKMKIGYEFYRAKCKRRDQRFKHESAA